MFLTNKINQIIAQHLNTQINNSPEETLGSAKNGSKYNSIWSAIPDVKSTEISYNACTTANNNINSEIEDSRQGNIGDCWLLSIINSMSNTTWGRKAIKESIKPDGQGGAIVTLKLKIKGKIVKKEIHITKDEIKNARKQNMCSTGDDDVAVLELAFKKHFQNIDGGNADNAQKVVELLCGETVQRYLYIDAVNININKYSEYDKALQEIEKNPDKYIIYLNFKENSEMMGMYAHHAYTIKKITRDKDGNMIVHLVNPWDSSQVLELPFRYIATNINKLCIMEKSNKRNPKLISNFEKLEKDIEGDKINIELHNAFGEGDDDKIKNAIKKINKDNILYVFKNKENLSRMITLLDLYKSGWGKGKAKKELIFPIVDALCLKAEECGVNPNIIEKTKTTCEKELDATFYTNEKTIIKTLENLYDEICKKR